MNLFSCQREITEKHRETESEEQRDRLIIRYGQSLGYKEDRVNRKH